MCSCAVEISQWGSSTASSMRVRIIRSAKRYLFLDQLPCNNHAHLQVAIELARSASKDPISRIEVYFSIRKNAATRASKDEPRGATLEEHVKGGPKGLQVFVQFACESRNRERHSSSFGPLPSSILFFVWPVRSGTTTIVAQLRSEIRAVAVIWITHFTFKYSYSRSCSEIRSIDIYDFLKYFIDLYFANFHYIVYLCCLHSNLFQS